jgi:hypothetical protein
VNTAEPFSVNRPAAMLPVENADFIPAAGLTFIASLPTRSKPCARRGQSTHAPTKYACERSAGATNLPAVAVERQIFARVDLS